MKTQNALTRALALVTLSALAACGGAGSGPLSNYGNTIPAPIGSAPTGTGLTARIVGVGDSLTAGTQSNAMLGQLGVTSPVSGFPGNSVPPTQFNGFWSLIYEQATGMTPIQMATPGTSVLPLIGAPGIGAQIVIGLGGVPIANTHSSCDTFNQATYSLATYATVRLNTTAPTYDLGVPGITAHEALNMTAPIAPTCVPIPGLPANVAGLLAITQSESNMFYPMLGAYANSVSPLTEVNTAVALRPTLTTVWLGANDLLHYTFSNGVFTGVDTPSQMQTDITTTIQKLQAVGSKVAVANLPNILEAAQFFQGGTPPATVNGVPTCAVQNYIVCGVINLLGPVYGVPTATAIGSGIAANVQTNNGVGPNGYLTEAGFFCALQQFGKVPSVNLDNCTGAPGPVGSGAGQFYLTDSFAANVQSLNTGYNVAIKAAAAATGAPLVDIASTIDQIHNVQAPGFALASSINPGKCCTTVFGGGLFSLDGLHPSDTGYALIANLWIQAIDTSLGGTILPVNATAVYNGSAPYLYPDPYAQH